MIALENRGRKYQGQTEKTLGIIKPEAIYRGLVDEIEHRILAEGLEISKKEWLVLSDEQFDILYGSSGITKFPEALESMRECLTSNPIITLIVSGDYAVNRLISIRGTSNPADSPPGTIRGDYARDQDYRDLGSRGDFARNVFHASDSVEEAEHMIDVLFGGDSNEE